MSIFIWSALNADPMLFYDSCRLNSAGTFKCSSASGDDSCFAEDWCTLTVLDGVFSVS